MPLRPEDEQFMRLALREGKKGLGRTSPNPPVGAVVVRNGKVVGKGYHHRAGTPHAEVHALRQAGEAARGATIYVTLEPCNHYGRTPPCTRAILEAGIKRVVIGVRDPHPQAKGGADFLREQGLEVVTGVLAEECAYLSRFFLKAVSQKTAWVVAKAAMSLDGRIATRTGDSQWITGEKARRFGHGLRNICDAILVGRGTVEADDPALTCRLARGRDPWRLVLDTDLRLDPKHRIFHLSSRAPTVVVAGEGAPEKKAQELEALGVKVWFLPRDERGGVHLKSLLKRLVDEGLLSLLVEGGGKVHGRFFDDRLVDEVYFFYGPVVIGGEKAPAAIGGEGPERLKDALWLKDLRLKRLGQDFLLHGLLTDPLSLKSSS